MRTALKRIETQNQGAPNGFVLPIWRADSGEKIEQVYMTVVMPGTVKGPHLHRQRCGRFTCIKGDIEIIARFAEGTYKAYWTGEISGFATIHIPPGVPAQIRCLSGGPAYVLNMPTPAWSAEDPDEWPVESWDPKDV